jgi:hypothetical protein
MSNRIHILVYSLGLSLMVAASISCSESRSSQPSEDSPAGASLAQLISQAQLIHAEAQALGHGWNVTGELIKESQSAANAGDEARAKILIERALGTARASVAQARTEETAWQKRFRTSFNQSAE